MFWLVIETFVLMLVFVALGAAIGIVLRQAFDRPTLAPAGAFAAPIHGADAHGTAPAPLADEVVAAAPVETPVVVAVARPDVEEPGPVVEPLAAETLEGEPMPEPAAPVATAETVTAPAAIDGVLAAGEAVIDPAKAAAADQVGTRPEGYAGARDGVPDDLKVIKGIGPQNEARLNALGVFHFDQIAAWTPEEARWVGSYLAFPGRIEREGWIAQARSLASGGAEG
ncbi:hypothetical protein [Oharaeibacter diazotrophicus]|uniref:Putative flap endonuclease-1-like 5' DNA nuclease n=1 Tax=Oharaeibacter diazotrophicus TaxID=1920512 RepID=A0A4R6RLW2_9HYPH|nr:hypothetical protein [Oharaeibacter diazotrophicus]TDP87502.1 putative flap endonuclease-1-like 5' DNA nuclease [Oharaeibacter diazotrophicus]BBE70554.1 30S ribosomal protein S2 [Pleomorphomonas sp. SM30]GLS77300.1 hypothetical protein GCM10007904_26370 [Oharaeibacter diazotrophicus]